MSQPVRQEYDRLADEYDARWQRYIDASLQLAAEVIELQGQEQVLDLACGTGQLAARLLARWPQLQITGVDVSSQMLRRACARQLRVHWLCGEAASLPLADEQFDVVACLSAFHYFRQPRRALVEMRRVLRPGGQLIVVDWCDDYLSCKLCSAWLRLTDRAFYKTYSLAEYQTELQHAGFRVLSAVRRRIDWLWGMMRLVATSPL